MYPAQFEYYAPATVSEAVNLLGQHADAKILAGGHSLLPLMKLRLATPAALIDIGKITELRVIRDMGDTIALGALTTHHDVEHSALLRSACPLLPEVASHIGDLQVRNRGTIGGSLSHSDPAADYPAAMLALGAEIEATGAGSQRTIKAEDFFKGLLQTALNANEILTQVRVPKTRGAGNGIAYEKFSHPASRYAVVGVAVWIKIDNDQVTEVRVGITGAADHALRARAMEDAMRGKPLSDELEESASMKASDGMTCLSDMYASADYRAHLVNVLAKRALHKAHWRAHGM